MPKSVIELNYCKKCGCNLTKLDSSDTVCDDCKDVPIASKEHKCDDDDGSCCIKDDETELIDPEESESDFCEDDFYPYYPED
jgi:hypothetical protein